MKIDFSQKFKMPGGGETETLGTIAAVCLNAPKPDKSPYPADEAVRRGSLALKVFDAAEMDITPEQATLIRSALPLAWPNVVVALATEALNG